MAVTTEHALLIAHVSFLLMLSSDFRGSRSAKACSAVLDVLLKTSEDIGLLLVWEKIPREISNGVFFRTQVIQ